MRSIRFSDQVSEEEQLQLRDLPAGYSSRRQPDYRINSLPRIKKQSIVGGSGLRTSTSNYGSLHRRPLSAMARSQAMESDGIDDYYVKPSRTRNHRSSHSRPSLSAMRTTSLDDSQGYYPPSRPTSRARTGLSSSRTGSMDGSGPNRLNYLFPTNHSVVPDPLDTYHHSQLQLRGSRTGSIDDTAIQLSYYNTGSLMNHPPKIQRQRSLNTDYPDEFDYQNMYPDTSVQADTLAYTSTDYAMDAATSRLDPPYSSNSIRRQPESILKNGHLADANGSTPRSGLNPDLGPEGSVAGSSYRSSSDGFDRGSNYYPAKKSSVCSSRGYSKSSEDSYNNETATLLNSRLENNDIGVVTGSNPSNGNGSGGGVLRPLRQHNSIPNSNSYGRLHTGNGNTMLGMSNNRVDDFEVYNKMSYNNNSSARSVLSNGNGNSLNGSSRRKKEEDGEYPTIGRAPSSGSQIIAKPIRPCCGGCCGGSTSSAINEGNPHQHAVPICLLFIIFLFAAACVVAGIMFYLKSGKTPTGLFHGF